MLTMGPPSHRRAIPEALQPDLVFFSGVASACEKTSKWTKVLELFVDLQRRRGINLNGGSVDETDWPGGWGPKRFVFCAFWLLDAQRASYAGHRSIIQGLGMKDLSTEPPSSGFVGDESLVTSVLS